MSPGDEVICTNTHCLCRCSDLLTPRGEGYDGYKDPEIGRHYVVGKVDMGICDRCRTKIPLMTPVGREKLGVPPPYAWAQEWFRPLEYDEDEAVRNAGVILPVKLRETV